MATPTISIATHPITTANPTRVYVGQRTAQGASVLIRQEAPGLPYPLFIDPLPLRLDLCNHSPSGFEWGYLGSGPAQLALALLAHATGDDAYACAQYQTFKEDVVARLPPEQDWRMTDAQVLEWVDRHPLIPDDRGYYRSAEEIDQDRRFAPIDDSVLFATDSEPTSGSAGSQRPPQPTWGCWD